MKKKTAAAIISLSIAGVAIIGVCGGFAWKEYNRYEPKAVTLELGEKPEDKPELYVAANDKLLADTKLDFSSVDTMKAGTYMVKATDGKHEVESRLTVEDTTTPELFLKDGEHKVMVGKKLKAKDLIEKADDLSGIKEISFSEGQIDLKGKDLIGKAGLKFDTAGDKTVKVTVKDTNGNMTSKELTIKVIEDYLAHVDGFQDITLEEGSTVDWLAGITKNEKILEITPDTSTVNTNKPGEYILKYNIKGDDKETTVEQQVKVVVTAKPEPKSDPVVTASGTSSKKSGDSGISGTSGNSSSGGNSSPSTPSTPAPEPTPAQAPSGDQPGQTYDMTKTGEGTCEDTGINWEGGTW